MTSGIPFERVKTDGRLVPPVRANTASQTTPPVSTACHFTNTLDDCNTPVYYSGMTTVINDSDAKRNIAFHVARILGQNGRSRYWLAKETGEWQTTIANVCNAKSVPGAGLLARIADALGCATDDLLKPIPKVGKKLSEIA